MFLGGVVRWDAGGAGLRIGAPRAYAQGVSYTYDAAGRLIGVVDPTGASAIYQYDAAGNIVSIQRNPAGTVVIIGFTPASGPAATQVMISGAGFGTTSNTSVSFNGVAATPTSVTSTTIVAPVPSGATSGPIMVTAPGGTATSTSSFTVGAAPAAPTISGFTPQTAVPGTAMTISGTNFDTTATNDKVLFDTQLAIVTAATSTSLTATVPQAGSGRITVETSAGQAVSTSDFIIPPAPHATTDVLSSARMTLGQSATVTVGTAGKIALMLFDGAAGHKVSVLVTSSTIAGGTLAIYGPAGNNLGFSANLTNGSFLAPQPLFTTGTYTVLVAPSGTNTGSVTFTLYDASDATGTLTIGGPTVTVPITAPGQAAVLTFAGTAGQRVSLLLDPTALGGIYGLSVLNPDGTTYFISPGSYNTAFGTFFTDVLVLPQTGTYTFRGASAGAGTGNVLVTVYSVPPDFTGTITAGGPAVQVPITTPGQNGILTFSGNAGDRISVLFHPGSIGGTMGLSLLNPDNTTYLIPFGVYNTAFGDSFSDVLVLPQTGTYAYKVDPQGPPTGTATVTLYSVPPDFTATITANGPAVQVPITTPGQNGILTFRGTAGQHISVLFHPGSIGGIMGLSLLNPDNTTYLIPPGAYNTAFGDSFSDALTLPQTGTYTYKVDPQGTPTGTATVTLYGFTDFTGTITASGPAVQIPITTPGQNGYLTFSGTAGNHVSLLVNFGTIPGSVVFSVLNPDNSTYLVSPTSWNTAWGNYFSDALTLAQTGTYTFKLDPQWTSTGTATVNLYAVTDFTGTITASGPAVQIPITSPGQNGYLTFSGTAGNHVSLLVNPGTIPGSAILSVLNPDNTTYLISPVTWNAASGNYFSDALTLA